MFSWSIFFKGLSPLLLHLVSLMPPQKRVANGNVWPLNIDHGANIVNSARLLTYCQELHLRFFCGQKIFKSDWNVWMASALTVDRIMPILLMMTAILLVGIDPFLILLFFAASNRRFSEKTSKSWKSCLCQPELTSFSLSSTIRFGDFSVSS